MEELVLAALAFLAMSFVGFGLFGRPDQSRPTCRACGTDARPFAWEDAPKCACGAALDRPGAVRTRGRIRRPRLVALGALVGAGAMGGWALESSLGGTSLQWIDLLPFPVARAGVEQRWRWAMRSVERRQQADALTDEEFADALDTLLSLAAPIEEDVQVMQDTLVWRWRQSPVAFGRVGPMVGGLSVFAEPRAPDDGTGGAGDTIGFSISLSPLDGTGEWLVRLERVSVAGEELPFAMRRSRASDATRIATPDEPAKGEIRLAGGDSALPVEITFELTVARTCAAEFAAGDALIDSTHPSNRWEVDVVAAPVTRTVRVERRGPQR